MMTDMVKRLRSLLMSFNEQLGDLYDTALALDFDCYEKPKGFKFFDHKRLISNDVKPQQRREPYKRLVRKMEMR